MYRIINTLDIKQVHNSQRKKINTTGLKSFSQLVYVRHLDPLNREYVSHTGTQIKYK